MNGAVYVDSMVDTTLTTGCMYATVSTGLYSLLGTTYTQSRVYYTQDPINTEPYLDCSIDADLSNHTAIACRTSLGSGNFYRFLFLANENNPSVVAVGFDTFSYPIAPVVYSVSGCSPGASNSTMDCPTTG